MNTSANKSRPSVDSVNREEPAKAGQPHHVLDASGRPIQTGRARSLRARLTQRRLIALIGFLACVTAIATNVPGLLRIGSRAWESITGLPVDGPRILTEAVEVDEEEPEHELSFVLTNPGTRYAVLRRIWLEVMAFEKREFYEFPAAGTMYAMVRRAGTVSGPVEVRIDRVRLNDKVREYALFPAWHNQVFPTGETQEFVLSVVPEVGGYFKYRVCQQWHLPQDTRTLVTRTQVHTIEYRKVHSAAETAELLGEADKSVVAILTPEDILQMVDQEHDQLWKFSLFESIELGEWETSAVSFRFAGFAVPIGLFVHNLASLAALDKMPAEIDLRVLTLADSRQEDRVKTAFLLDGEELLLEADETGPDGEKLGVLIRNPSAILKFLRTMQIPHHGSPQPVGHGPAYQVSPWYVWRFSKAEKLLRFEGLEGPGINRPAEN